MVIYLAIVVVLGLVIGAVFVWDVARKLDMIPRLGEDTSLDSAADDEPRNYLVVGSDSREDLDSDADESDLYTKPEEVAFVYEELSKVSDRFTIAAAFDNVHGVYKPGNVKLKPSILRDSQEYVADKFGTGPRPLDFVFHGGSGSAAELAAQARIAAAEGRTFQIGRSFGRIRRCSPDLRGTTGCQSWVQGNDKTRRSCDLQH